MHINFPLTGLYIAVLSRRGAQALSLSATAIQPTSHACADRTIWNIVWSCLVTISLCTWVASHPNMLGLQNGKIIVSLFRAWLAVDALLTPELIIAWAMQQWFVAHKSVRDVNNPRWTTTHGYFISMGGFVLHGGCPDRSDHPLTPDEFVFLVRNGYIDVPNITDQEIMDKSKGDMVSKGLTVLQAGWFVTQCFARLVQSLPVTELELATLAFAVTNTITYLFWWNKPLNVHCAVAIALKKPIPDKDWERCIQLMGSAENVEDEDPPIDIEEAGIEMEPSNHVSNSDAHPTEDKTCNWPIYMFESVRTSQSREWRRRTTTKRVHRWYSGHLPPDRLLVSFLVAGASAETFGAIHCIAWYFPFPSHVEQISWRICCVVIMSVPVFLAMIFGTLTVFQKFFLPSRSDIRHIVAMTRYVYILARLVMLVQMFASLRSVPLGVYKTVDWTAYVPHI